jgi:hypothetical protein
MLVLFVLAMAEYGKSLGELETAKKKKPPSRKASIAVRSGTS